MTNRSLKPWHIFGAWLAIVALLIDALLPTAVSAAAAVPGAPVPTFALCRSAAGAPPTKHEAPLPICHCAMCPGPVFGLSPSHRSVLTARLLTGTAHPAVISSPAPQAQRPLRTQSQPRAPPRLA